jgi:hypothetical protein
MSLTLVGMTKRGNAIDLKYTFDDADPFVLTVSSQFVAQRTGQSGP